MRRRNKRNTVIATVGGAVVAGAAAVALPLVGVGGATTAMTSSGEDTGSDQEVPGHEIIPRRDAVKLLDKQGITPNTNPSKVGDYEITHVPDYVDGESYSADDEDLTGAQYWLDQQVVKLTDGGERIDPTLSQLSVESSTTDADSVKSFLKSQDESAKEFFADESFGAEPTDTNAKGDDLYYSSDQALVMVNPGEILHIKLAPEDVDPSEYWTGEADAPASAPDEVAKVAEGIKGDGKAPPEEEDKPTQSPPDKPTQSPPDKPTYESN